MSEGVRSMLEHLGEEARAPAAATPVRGGALTRLTASQAAPANREHRGGRPVQPSRFSPAGR
ncbi:hypothetical protein AN218_27960 [Streptomyces nanshensis]|uniref:Uncharacterized protein n=1 Tax=Streptomyces nanshensis TaxID=518642 RepID=A0A1E7KVW2_9ACTN|nr:hypothetical protein AN218_27960 [Streptomyces nanshensis]